MLMATSSSNIPKQASPSFFKVFHDSSSHHLPLPSAFVRRHLKKISENLILKTVNGEHQWRLKIRKIDEEYCFTHGWNKFVQDFQLGVGDFLVFRLIDSSIFQILIFHRDGCEKDPPSTWSRETVIKIEDDDDNIPDEDPCFQMAISEKTHKDTMELSRNFVVKARIIDKCVVKIKDLEGREWLVELLAERHHNTKYFLSSGWSIFREYNELSDGDICLFKFTKKEGVLALAQVIKNKNPRKEEIREKKTLKVETVKRKRGRPPLKKPHGGGDDGGVKIKDGSGQKVETVKRKKERPPLKKPQGGGGCVRTEDTPSSEVEVVKRKRGRPPFHKSRKGGVKTRHESDPKAVVVKRKRGRPPLVKPDGGGVAARDEELTPEVEVVKQERGRSCLESYNRSNRVIYF